TQTYGPEAAKQVCIYDQTHAKTTIRVNDPLVLEELQRDGIRARPGSLLTRAFLVEAGDITQTKAFHERRLIIQDEASQLVALLVGKGNTILDCCAAPGGKTRIMAEQ